MKSVKDLQKIKDQMLKKNSDLLGSGGLRVVVGMATCGIAAGARPVMDTFIQEIASRNLKNVEVVQTGCIGVCRLEPLVDVYQGDKKVTYVHMNPDKALRVITEHLVNGHVVESLTIGAADA